MSQNAAGNQTDRERVQEPEAEQASGGEPVEAESDIDSQSPGPDFEALRREAEENWNKYLRAVAELENLRKRAARDVENARKRGVEQLAQALLPVRDSLEAGVAASEQADADALLEGKRATLRLLDSALESVGVVEIDPLGEPFDPEQHEAMTMQPSDQAEPNTVLTVIQKGYQVHGRLLRPARVIVAQASPETAEPERED